MKVVIIGGSISGLLNGLMFKHAGHDVHILERVSRDLEAQGAGVGTASEMKTFLSKHDRLSTAFALPSTGIRVYDASTTLTSSFPAPDNQPFQLTTWDAMYYRLRANFDQLASPHSPDPPTPLPTDGQAIYDMGKTATGIARRDGRFWVEYSRTEAPGEPLEPLAADVIIAADGAASRVREMVAPGAPQRRYAGFVAWRGMVRESAVAEEVRALMTGHITIHTGADQYVVVYHVPGRHGSLAPGERALNVVWYSWQPPAALDDILLDVDGHRHRWSVPAGKLRPDVWARQKRAARGALGAEVGALIDAVDSPFVQLISDCDAPGDPGPAFYGGRVFLVGDAQRVLRPHTGWALNQTARHCLELEKRLPALERLVREEAGAADVGAIAEWNQGMLEYGHLQSLRSAAFGMWYLRPARLGWVPAALRWRVAEWVLAMKQRWRALFRRA